MEGDITPRIDSGNGDDFAIPTVHKRHRFLDGDKEILYRNGKSSVNMVGLYVKEWFKCRGGGIGDENIKRPKSFTKVYKNLPYCRGVA